VVPPILSFVRRFLTQLHKLSQAVFAQRTEIRITKKLTSVHVQLASTFFPLG
jgi:hypothetical protein